MHCLARLCLVLLTLLSSSARAFDTGNEQMLRAWESAMMRCIVNEAWADSFEHLGGVFQSGDCISEPNRYPTPPSSQIVGTLADVIKGGSLRMGTAEIATQADPALSAAMFRFSGKVLKEIGIAYNVRNLRLDMVQFNSSDAVFAALERGDIHMAAPFFAMGGVYNGTLRRERFLSSCATVSVPMTLVAHKNTSLTAWEQIVRSARPISIAYITPTDRDILGALFLTARLVQVPSLEAALLALRAHAVDVVYLDSTSAVNTSAFNSFFGPSSVPLTAFFKRDAVEIDDNCRYPSIADQAVSGNDELRRAWDAAFVRVVHNGTFAGAWLAVEKQYGMNESLASLAGDCTPNPELFPWPEPTPGGVLQQMLDEGEFEDRKSNPWADTSWYAVNLILHAIVDETAKHYKKPLVVSHVKMPADMTLGLDMLAAGLIDSTLPTYTYGAFWHEERRSVAFAPTCTFRLSPLRITVLAASKIRDYDDLYEARNTQIAVLGPGTRQVIMAAFPFANVTVYDEFHAVIALRQGKIDALVGAPLRNITFPVRTFDANTYEVTTAFMRRDTVPCAQSNDRTSELLNQFMLAAAALLALLGIISTVLSRCRTQSPVAEHNLLLLLPVYFMSTLTDLSLLLYLYGRHNTLFLLLASFCTLGLVVCVIGFAMLLKRKELRNKDFLRWLHNKHSVLALVVLLSVFNPEFYRLIRSTLFDLRIFSAPETLAVPVWLSTLGLISNGLRDFPRLLLSIYLWKYAPTESHIVVLLAFFGSAFVLLHSILKRVLRLVWTQGVMRKSFAVWAGRGGSFNAPLLLRPSRADSYHPSSSSGNDSGGKLLQPSSRAAQSQPQQPMHSLPTPVNQADVPRSDSQQSIASVAPTPQSPGPTARGLAASRSPLSSPSPSFGKATTPSLVARTRMFDRRPLPSAVSLQALTAANAEASSDASSDHGYHLLTDGAVSPAAPRQQQLLDEEAELDRRSQIVPISV